MVLRRKKPSSWKTVKRGDSLASLAKKHGLTPQQLASMNRIATDVILSAGDKIKVG